MDAQGVDRRRPRRARFDDGHLRRRPRARPGRGGERGDVRGPIPRDRRARDLRRRAHRAPARALRPMTSGGHERRWAAAILAALALLALLPAATIASYRLTQRYYLALGLAAVSVIAVTALATSRLGLGMRAIREDEEAAEASGVGALSLKLTALALSTALAGLAGGLFAYYPNS